MSEQAKRHGACFFDADERCWWYAPNGLDHGIGEALVSFDPEDGSRLNPEGTVTPMVERIMSEAVQNIRFYDLLWLARKPEGLWFIPGVMEHQQCCALEALDLWLITDEGHTILATLRQPAPAAWVRMAVAQWLGEKCAGMDAALSQRDGPPDSADWWVLQAIAAAGQPAASEPADDLPEQGPSAEEMEGALRYAIMFPSKQPQVMTSADVDFMVRRYVEQARARREGGR